MSSFASTNGAVAKVVLITGASSGIGKACADYLAERGWQVFAAHRTATFPYNSNIEMVTMDVNDNESVKRGIASLLSKANRLDAVINNAGSVLWEPLKTHR